MDIKKLIDRTEKFHHRLFKRAQRKAKANKPRPAETYRGARRNEWHNEERSVRENTDWNYFNHVIKSRHAQSR